MMRTSATGRGSDPARRCGGFTLIELLVTTAILATVALAAVLSLRMAPGESPAARMEELARTLRYLQEEAMYTRRSFALSFARGSWRVLELDESDERWKPRADGRPYRSGVWNPNFTAELRIEGRRVAMRDRLPGRLEPDVVLLSSGENTPFSLSLEDNAGRVARCRLGASGDLECTRGA